MGPPVKSYAVSGPWQEGGPAWSSSELPAYRLTLFAVTPGCFEESTEHDSTLVATVPKGVTRQLRQKMLGSANSVSLSLPILDQIPEEGAVGAGPDMGEMDGENNAEEANEEPSSDEEEPPPPEFHPTPSQLRDLRIAHDNAGHPTNVDFARLLRRGNARPELANWVRHHFRCEACEAHRPPKARRPAAVPKTYRANHVIGIDLVEIKNFRNERQMWINIGLGHLVPVGGPPCQTRLPRRLGKAS